MAHAITYYTGGDGPTCLDCKGCDGHGHCNIHGVLIADMDMKRCDVFSSLVDGLDPATLLEGSKS